MTSPTDEGNVGDERAEAEKVAADKVGTAMRDMLSAGRQPAPPVTAAELRHRAERSRHRHIDAKVVVALVAVAAVIAALIVIGPLRSSNGRAHKPTATHPSSTTSTTTTTTTTTIPVAAASALATYVADQEQTDSAAAESNGITARYHLNPFVAVHSAPTLDDGTTVAVAAFSYDPDGHPVQVLRYRDGQWTQIAGLASPTGFGTPAAGYVDLEPQGPVAVADVTGDGRPDFLLAANGADNIPGFVLSEDGGPWHYIPFSGPYAQPPTEVIARDPQFVGNKVETDYDNCVPDCAGGTNTTVVWTYQPSSGEFTAPDPPGYISPGQTVAACLASALSASATQGSGAGGQEAVVVVFTNTSSGTCSVQGYPTTAWFEGPGGVHLPATVTQEVASAPPATVTLAPGQKAATTVWTDDPAVPSASSCNPVAANAVTIGTSAATSALTEPIAITVCSTNNSIGTTAFTAGTAQSPM
jgi:hypothetical protein